MKQQDEQPRSISISHAGRPEAIEDDMNAIRPQYTGSAASQDTIRATPPIAIPIPSEEAVIEGSEESFVEQYMRTRQPSVSFNNEVRLEHGGRQSIDEPLKKPPKERIRGRSLLQVLNDDKPKDRAHSESDREHYDPFTGRHLPEYSTSPQRDHPRIGEARFPMLQTTVDAMARESQTDLPQVMSLTSDSTISPLEEVSTPKDHGPFPQSEFTPFSGSSASFSYEEPKPFRRTASQRWRDGEGRDSAQDFFSRAGSLRQGRTYSSSKLSKKDTPGSIVTPRSAASSYLRAFSMSSSHDGDNAESGPPAVDAEGQTIGEDYVLGKQIGYGGFSIIKEVTQMRGSVPRKLAAKIVRRHIAGKSDTDNDQAQAEFEHEVELWRFLDHPNVLPLEAVYKMDEATFCFIPLNTGGTLFDIVRTNRSGLPPELAREYTHQLASALRYLHLDARVVHRDVKLENCLLERLSSDPDGPGLVRVCDFGMAEWLTQESESFNSGPPSPTINSTDRPPPKQIGPADTSTSAFAGGSLEYAAPEILRVAQSSSPPRSSSSSDLDSTRTTQRSIVSPAVDIWAFGVCVYSLVVGSRPFQSSFQPRVTMAILAGDWDRDILREKGGDEAFDLVSGCLEMDERDRWDIGRILDCDWLEGMGGREEMKIGSQQGGGEEQEEKWKL